MFLFIPTNISLFLRPCRQADLEALASSLQQYRDGHSALIKWIEETTERQENAQPGQTDSRALAEQLAQQTVSVRVARVVLWFPNLLVTLKVKNATLRICFRNETLSPGVYV